MRPASMNDWIARSTAARKSAKFFRTNKNYHRVEKMDRNGFTSGKAVRTEGLTQGLQHWVDVHHIFNDVNVVQLQKLRGCRTTIFPFRQDKSINRSNYRSRKSRITGKFLRSNRRCLQPICAVIDCRRQHRAEHLLETNIPLRRRWNRDPSDALFSGPETNRR